MQSAQSLLSGLSKNEECKSAFNIRIAIESDDEESKEQQKADKIRDTEVEERKGGQSMFGLTYKNINGRSLNWSKMYSPEPDNWTSKFNSVDMKDGLILTFNNQNVLNMNSVSEEN